MSDPSLSSRDGEKASTHGRNVLSITDRLLQKSNSAINKLDENISLTNSLRKSNNLISKIDTQIDDLTGNLQQYQHYLSQLNSLMIRSEFFEAQLNMLEAHNQLDSLRSSEGMPGLNDWKDDDLNWRTTESTLENLYLEYQYLTKQMEQISDPEAFKAVIQRQYNPEPPIREDISGPRPSLQSKMSISDMNLKPIRILSRKEDKRRRKSMEINKKRPIASIPTIYGTQYQPTQLQHKNLQSLPTPETSFDYTMGDTTTDHFNYHDESMVSPLSDIKHCSSRRNSHSTINKHTRSSSLPESIVPNMLDTLKFSLADDPLSPENSKNRKFSLRHFISHETGLKTKGLIAEEDEEDVKDSEFLSSPVSINLESYLKPKPPTVSKGKEPENPTEESVILEEEEPPFIEEVTMFDHKLNRSNSCDSIFSTMKAESYIPRRDNKQHTMNWMKQISIPQSSSAKESNVTTLSVNNLSSSISSPSRKALTDLVTQNSSTPKSTLPNRFPFLFSAKKSSPLASTSEALSTSTTTTASSSTFHQNQETQAQSIPTPAKRQLSVDSSSSYHSFESSYSNSPQHKQWSLLLNKFKPKGMVQSSNFVTSEVGKPLPIAQPITIYPQDNNNYNKPHVSSSLAPQDKIKGSFSTLTIGPNRSKVVQHGDTSTLGQSLVVSSKISHAALRDALTNDFKFK